MTADLFWNIIEDYNRQTWIYQAALMGALVFGFILSLKKRAQWFLKITLGVANLFIGTVFFLYYGTEPIQHYFAAPLFLAAGALFILEGVRFRDDEFGPLTPLQWSLLVLVCLYPLVSFLLGNTFPRMVVYIMPCPLVSFSIVLYSGYKRKNIVLLALLTLWGLTGIKSFFFNALEDIILLLCGIYCAWCVVSEIGKRKRAGIKES